MDRDQAKKERKGYPFFLKAAAFFFALLFLFTAALSALTAALCFAADLYGEPSADAAEEKLLSELGERDLNRAIENYLAAYEASSVMAADARINPRPGSRLAYAVTDVHGGVLSGDLEGREGTELARRSFYVTLPRGAIQTRWMVLLLLEGPAVLDPYSVFGFGVRAAYTLRYAVYAIFLLSLLFAVLLHLFLLRAAGRRRAGGEPQTGFWQRIPFDLLTAVAVLAVLFVLYGASRLPRNAEAIPFPLLLALPAVLFLFFTALWLLWTVDLALRIKTHTLLARTLLYLIFVRGIWGGLHAIALVPRTVLLFLLFSAAELVLVWKEFSYRSYVLPAWFFLHLIAFLYILWWAVSMKKLKQSGEALASGDLSYRTAVSRMPRDLARHGEKLNSISAGVADAVERQLKSERMKTELITNVSHDLKTPLTSLVSYADLIAAEPTENPKITEYAGELTRQSARMKKLIEDLVEASKASSGNLEVVLAPTDLSVLIAQSAAEYEERFAARGLSLLVREPDEPLSVLADGRRLWRVFDNLLGNAAKHAAPDSRVYLDVKREENYAVLTFKNVSEAPLNIPAEELTERFVRGDSARSGEGSGLGLAIAKSLTELQNGFFRVEIDGDLFKAVVSLPLAPCFSEEKPYFSEEK